MSALATAGVSRTGPARITDVQLADKQAPAQAAGAIDAAKAVAVDRDNNIYVAGFTESLEAGAGLGEQITVTKLSAGDKAVVFSTTLGGSADDRALALAVTNDGEAVVTGVTYSPDFPVTPGAFDTSYGGGGDVFVLRLAPDGSSLSFSTYLGGKSYDDGAGIDLDPEGRIYLAGQTDSSDFPTTPQAFDRTKSGQTDAFVARLDASGSNLGFAGFLGGSGEKEWATDIAVDAQGRAHIVGVTDSPDFPTTMGAFDRGFNGGRDAFVTRVTPDGSSLAYSTFLGGSGRDQAHAVAIGPTGDTYVTGEAESSDFPTSAGALDRVLNGYGDAFVTRLAAGGGMVYSTLIGGTVDEEGFGLAVDGSGRAYVTGYTGSADFPVTTGAAYRAEGDVFFTALAPNGSQAFHSTLLGGTDYDESYGLALDSKRQAHIVGETASSDFPSSTLGRPNGYADAFLASVQPDTAPPTGSFVIDGGTYTNRRKSKARLSFTDDFSGIGEVRFRNEGGSWSSWREAAKTLDWELTGGDGEKRVFAQAKDRAGNTGPVVSDTIFLDTKKPVATLRAPWVSTKISNRTTFQPAWTGNEVAPGSGIDYYRVRFRPANTGAWTDWKTTRATTALFPGTAGRTYYFRAVAYDRAGNAGWSKRYRTIVPYDENRLVYRQSGWRGRQKGRHFYRGSVRYSVTRGNTIVYKFYGDQVSLVTTKGRGRGKAKIFIDGRHRKTIDAYSSRIKYRQAVATARWKRRGTHYLKIVNLGTPGRPRFDIDGVAVGR